MTLGKRKRKRRSTAKAPKTRLKGGETGNTPGKIPENLKFSPELEKFLIRYTPDGGRWTHRQVVKYIWEYVKSKGLQDPANKRIILPDEELAKLFETPLDMFQLARQLSRHISRVKPKEGQIILSPHKRAVLVKGDTYRFRVSLKRAKGRWNPSLGGWIFPVARREEVKNALLEVGAEVCESDFGVAAQGSGEHPCAAGATAGTSSVSTNAAVDARETCVWNEEAGCTAVVTALGAVRRRFREAETRGDVIVLD